MISQGDVFWLNLGDPKGHGLAYRHPHVVIQGDSYNRGGIHTYVVCGITSNLRIARFPGTVRLRKGEANLSKDSVVNITQIYTADENELTEKIGSLGSECVQEILKGVSLLLNFEN